MKTKKPTAKSQLQKFKDAAHELGADGSEEQFDAALKRVAKGSPAASKPKKAKRVNRAS